MPREAERHKARRRKTGAAIINLAEALFGRKDN